ncbi:hypothetical protein GTP56_12780 [Duganella sp. FT134W]|uniref:TolB amino-terminal domain-containing protein n=1 Tax=Duganella margarita TaxID=2692170 RepID=A0A7X4H0I8_9BURK|nr:hypothetical protein [Duganella margarita]MYM73065.1 hypothetical protein [Duganella margarita]
MNAHLELMNNEVCPTPTADRMRRAAALILSSPTFAKAPRMRQLLSFLIDAKLYGSADQLSEYAIGLAVFRRDPRVYDTALDPVVRVQTGRLRERLADYYRAVGEPDLAEISIPTGGYEPQVVGPAGPAANGGLRLHLAPLRDLSRVSGSDAFLWGLEEELGARLYRTFGAAVMVQALQSGMHGGATATCYRVEGSLRVEAGRARACVRLVETGAGNIAWVAQFDCDGDLDMARQEALAGDICAGLSRYLTVSAARWSPADRP